MRRADGAIEIAANMLIAVAERISEPYKSALEARATDIQDAIKAGFPLVEGVEDELKQIEVVLAAVARGREASLAS